MKTMKKVWRYISKYKKLLFISLSAMLVVQALGLLAPLIVKTILDDYLIGIQRPWYEVLAENDKTVSYQGRYFTQETENTNGISIVIIQGKYYFIDEIAPSGYKVLVGNQLTVTTQDNQVLTYQVVPLSRAEVLNFYNPYIQPLSILIILLMVRFFLQILFTYIQRISTSMINVNIVRDARKDAVSSLQRMPMTYFETEPAGKIANRIISDVGGMMNLFSTIMNLLVNATMAVIFAYIGMFYLDATLALMTFIVFPIIYIWLKFFIKKLNTIAVKVNEQSSMITAQLNEIINGIGILQIFNFRKQTEKKFNDLSADFVKEKIKENLLHLSIGWNLIRLLGALVTSVIILYFGNGYLSIPGFVVSVGIIYAYNDYLTRLIEQVGTLFREIGNLQHAIVKTERIFRIIDGEQEDGSFTEIKRFEGHVKFDNIWFSYEEGKPVLKGIDLDIKKGEMVGLVGHTGSGKSSLMSLLMRFYDLKTTDMGKIYIDDIDIETFSKRSFRTHVGIILQDPVMFKGTIADNVKFGNHQVSDEEVEKVIREIGGSKLLDKLEHGVLQMITRGGGNLSVGEKQIISFARAVIHDPAILVMDEATANIDTETETMIQQALETVKKGRTMIVIAHRLSTIKNADKIVVLENGIKVEEGRHKDLLSKNGVYANIYRSQIKTIAE
ncbi:MAG: ABC transporter ATP-binding protein [Tenericutes bacterium HGW-Tenericutes-2]|jgi:ATP-binding cassette subfamily B protein|nr:MAG: ABC transporter ATP-binding protein [Tenericutes bacterium HGW-Tenericutes-2]